MDIGSGIGDDVGLDQTVEASSNSSGRAEHCSNSVPEESTRENLGLN